MGSSVTISTAPIGSSEQTTIPSYGSEVVGSTILDSLSNGTESSAMTYANSYGRTYATVEIILGSISPTGTPSLQIISGSTGYEFTITTTASIARQVRFVDIPMSFLSSFTLKNLSGVALAASGNYVVITPQ